jgi:hypothetical protein
MPNGKDKLMAITLNNNTEKMKTAYTEAKADIASLLGWLECEMQKEPAKLNWGQVGSLTQVRTELLQTLSFISGIPEAQINDSLTEARLDNQPHH